jgi:hypothetical protein
MNADPAAPRLDQGIDTPTEAELVDTMIAPAASEIR